jgi:hypothetical protein
VKKRQLLLPVFILRLILSLLNPFKLYLVSIVITLIYPLFLIFFILTRSSDSPPLFSDFKEIPSEVKINNSQKIEVISNAEFNKVSQNLNKIYELSPTHSQVLKDLYLVSSYQKNKLQTDFYLQKIKAFSPNLIK